MICLFSTSFSHGSNLSNLVRILFKLRDKLSHTASPRHGSGGISPVAAYTPTSGKVLYGDTDIHHGSDKELSAFRRQKIGFIFQQFNLLSVLTAQKNIIMPLLLDRQQPDNAYLQEIVAFLGIDSRLTHLPHELSGGQQQRVAIARALITKPDIIFADEPTGNLDSKSGGEVMKMLCDLRAKMKKTLIVITHDPHIAEMAERRFTIIDGVLSEVTVR